MKGAVNSVAKSKYKISYNPQSGEVDSKTIPLDYLELLLSNGVICAVKVMEKIKFFVNSFIVPNVVSNNTLMAIFGNIDYCHKPICKKHADLNNMHSDCVTCKWRMAMNKEELENPPFIDAIDNFEQGEPPDFDDEDSEEYITYSKYLHTKYWKEFREKVIEHYGAKCCWCGAAGEDVIFNVHHIRYGKRFDEKLENVVLLCDSCHRKAHGKY